MHMKPFFLLLSFVLLTSLKAQNTTQKDFENVIENMFNDIFNKQEIGQLPKYFTSDIQLLEDGILYDYTQLNQMVTEIKQQFDAERKNNHLLTRENQFEFYKSYIKDEIAWITYKNSALFKMDGIEIAQIKWLESAVFVKTTEGWKIQLLTSSIIK